MAHARVAYRRQLSHWLAQRLSALWWRRERSALAQLLRPLAWLYAALTTQHRRRVRAESAPVAVVVVGNLVVGGAGKTPAVIALVDALVQAGWHPGVISRGFARQHEDLRPVFAHSDAAQVGDEPLLIQRRCGVPVWVGRARLAAARALCAAHPEVDVLVADDGLQHHQLARDAELLVFDERGVGNGLLLPAGPLREPVPQATPPQTEVLYTAGAASTALPGHLGRRSMGQALPLAAWWAGDQAAGRALASLRGRRCLAVAGIAAPEKFFTQLEAAGLDIRRCPLPDHADFSVLPWADDAGDVLLTEKDAVTP